MVRAGHVSRNAPFVDRHGRLTADAFRMMQVAAGLVTADRLEANFVSTLELQAEQIVAGTLTGTNFALNLTTGDWSITNGS